MRVRFVKFRLPKRDGPKVRMTAKTVHIGVEQEAWPWSSSVCFLVDLDPAAYALSKKAVQAIWDRFHKDKRRNAGWSSIGGLVEPLSSTTNLNVTVPKSREADARAFFRELLGRRDSFVRYKKVDPVDPVERLLHHQKTGSSIEVVFQSLYHGVGFDGDTLYVGVLQGVVRERPRAYGITYLVRTDPESTGVRLSPFALEKITGERWESYLGDSNSAFEFDTKTISQPRRRLRQVLSRPEAYVVAASRQEAI